MISCTTRASGYSGEISDYLQLSQTAMGSTKMITDNIVLWKETATAPLVKNPRQLNGLISWPRASPSPTAANLFIPLK